MRQSRFVCERCGSKDVRRSHATSNADSLKMLVGQYPLRCQNCQHRFWANILLLSEWRYARCPACLSFQLTTWDLKHYNIPTYRKVLMKLGARRFRCNPCRLNFVSFRVAKPQSHNPMPDTTTTAGT